MAQPRVTSSHSKLTSLQRFSDADFDPPVMVHIDCDGTYRPDGIAHVHGLIRPRAFCLTVMSLCLVLGHCGVPNVSWYQESRPFIVQHLYKN